MKESRSFAKRLGRKIIVETGLLFVISIFIIGLFSYYYIYMAAIKDAGSVIEKTSLEIEAILSGAEATTEGSAWLVDRYSSDEQMLRSVVHKIAESDSNIVSASIGLEPGVFRDDLESFCPTAYTDSCGLVRTTVYTGDEYDYQVMDWYLIPKLLGKPFWCDPSFDTNGSGRLVSSYCVPLYREDGTFMGVMKSDIDLAWLTKRLREIKPYEHSYTVLAGRNATIITRMDGSEVLDKTLFTDALEAGDTSKVNLFRRIIKGDTGVDRYKTKGRKGVIIYSSLKNGWPVALVCTDDDVLAETKRMNAISLIVAIIAVMLLYVRQKVIVSRESKAMSALSYSALSIAQGNFSTIIPEVEYKDELGRLHDSLAYLEDSIHRYIHELRSSTEANERYENELNIASSIQMQMLPRDYPNFEGVELYATLHPAKEVGGDLYDFFVKDRILYFAVGDVSGKGVPAALYMAITRSAFRFIAGLGLPVSGVVSRINNAFCDGNDSGMFVTMFVARINLDTLEMEFCNAGHNPILIVSPDGNAKYLHAKANLAAGLFEDFPYQGESLNVEKGSRLLVYTDGVTEAEDIDKNLYGEHRLEAFAASEPVDKSSSEFIEDLVSDVKKFTKDNVQNDDITIMSIKL